MIENFISVNEYIIDVQYYSVPFEVVAHDLA